MGVRQSSEVHESMHTFFKPQLTDQWGLKMSFQSVSFLQASFYYTPIFFRTLVHPVSLSVGSPDGRSWKTVNDEIFSSVGSKTLLNLVASELRRELRKVAFEYINGWVFHTKNALHVKELLQNASKRFAQIRDGIFAEETKRSLERLFVADPRYQARLSTKDDMNEAIEEVLRRVLSQCRLTWELGLFSSSDRRSFGIRLMVLMQDHLYEYLSQKDEESMMSSSHFHHFDSFLSILEQFKGVDTRFDKALCDYEAALQCLPDDGSSLYGGGLKEFWQELTRLGEYLNGELEKDFFEEPSLNDDFDEDSLFLEIQSEEVINDVVELDQCDIDVGTGLDWDSTSNDSISTVADTFDLGFVSIENFQLEPSPSVLCR